MACGTCSLSSKTGATWERLSSPGFETRDISRSRCRISRATFSQASRGASRPSTHHVSASTLWLSRRLSPVTPGASPFFACEWCGVSFLTGGTSPLSPIQSGSPIPLCVRSDDPALGRSREWSSSARHTFRTSPPIPITCAARATIAAVTSITCLRFNRTNPPPSKTSSRFGTVTTRRSPRSTARWTG